MEFAAPVAPFTLVQGPKATNEFGVTELMENVTMLWELGKSIFNWESKYIKFRKSGSLPMTMIKFYAKNPKAE